MKSNNDYLFLLIVLVIISPLAIVAQARFYPYPKEIKSSSVYQVKADGRSVFVYDAPVAPIASFDMEGPVEIEIKADRDIKWVDVRPRILGIKPEFKDSTIRFRLEKPCNISIELNGEFSNKPLFLFANPPEKNPPIKHGKGIHYFESGKVYTPGIIEVKSGEIVYIEGGAVVYGMIHAENASDIKILGRGILEGSKNQEYLNGKWRRFIDLKDCKDIRIEGITLVNSPTWQIVTINCDNVSISHVKIVSNNGGDDGIDIVRSRNVLVEGCFIHTKDDCIAIKSNFDYPGNVTNQNIMVTNSVFWNTEWGNALEIGFELRADTMRRITFRDCDVIHCDDGAVFSIHNGDCSVVTDVTFENIRVEDARQKLFDLAIVYSQYSVDAPRDRNSPEFVYQNGPWDGLLHLSADKKKEHARYRGKIRNVIFKDIQVVDGIFPFSVFCGYDEDHLVENIEIDNLTVHGKKVTNPVEAKLYMEHAKHIHFK
jgi:polygalacturonase